ncbi:hypothetical protein C2E23DRAFT_134679 [Lenzites betulinus]|nr:hypothetical protein C2E23DRAFT_134679 [Lenzites betulinus]
MNVTVLTTLRTYVLSGRNKLLGGVAMLLSLGPFLVNASTVYHELPVNLPPPENCTLQYSESVAEIQVIGSWRSLQDRVQY